MSDQALISYAHDLGAEVSTQGEAESVCSEEEFTRIVLERLADEGALDNPTLLYQEGTFGRVKYKISGFSISDAEDRILLATTVYAGELPPRRLAAEEIKLAIMHAVNFYKCSCDGLHEKIEPSNTEASDLARRIYEMHDGIDVLHVVLLSDCMTGLDSLDIRETKAGTRVFVDKYGIEKLHRILGAGLTRDDIVLDFEEETGAAWPCLMATYENKDFDAYLTAIPGSILADIYEKYGTRVLELNVRAFLGLQGRKSVNAGLRRTIQEEPTRFLAYNNGIVATADKIDIDQHQNGILTIRALRGLQIVNGGQTTVSLHRARKRDKTPIHSIAVPTKIILVKHGGLDSMVSAVSRCANSQNTIQPADFSANDPFHVAVERLANNTRLPNRGGRWFYERARGSYGATELGASFRVEEKRRFADETPKSMRFSKTDLAKYLNAWNGLPYSVSCGNQKNFQSFMHSMKEQYPKGFSPDEAWYKAFIGKAILFRTVQAIVRARKFPAYQANITAYTVACISWKSGGDVDFGYIWSHQALSPEMQALINDWVANIDQELRRTAGSRMPSEWAKKVQCWEAVRDVALDLPAPLPPEMQGPVAGGAAQGVARLSEMNL
jgi:AIPR protein/Abortive infection phage resistance protein N-terminal domain